MTAKKTKATKHNKTTLTALMDVLLPAGAIAPKERGAARWVRSAISESFDPAMPEQGALDDAIDTLNVLEDVVRRAKMIAEAKWQKLESAVKKPTKFTFTGDIVRAGTVSVVAYSLKEAEDMLASGDFVRDDEDNHMEFHPSGDAPETEEVEG